MIIPVIAAFCLGWQEESINPGIKLLDPVSHKLSGWIEQISEPLKVPEKSPKVFGDPPEHWLFNWETIVYENLLPGGIRKPRFLVFSQDRAPQNDLSVSVARMLERLWEFNYTRMNIDNPLTFGDGTVDVFLCRDGRAGGEQLSEEDRANGRARKVCSIYIYDVGSLSDPVEMAREVAHEFGHASLNGVNGYSEPEDWANGYLGEKLFLSYLSGEIHAGRLGSDDAMGAKVEDIDAWLRKSSEPLILDAAIRGPDIGSLRSRDSTGMSRFIGLALYTSLFLPTKAFSRSLLFLPSTNAEDYPETVLESARQTPEYEFNLPKYLTGHRIWLPAADCYLEGASVLKKSGGWVLVLPSGSKIRVIAKHPVE